jgi:hypothetical protein
MDGDRGLGDGSGGMDGGDGSDFGGAGTLERVVVVHNLSLTFCICP